MPSPEDVVAAFISAIEVKDLDAAVALLTDGVVYDNVPVGPIVGKETTRQLLEGFLDPAVEVEWRVLRQVAAGGVVVNERLDRFRLAEGWLELPVAGVFEVTEAGLIRLWRDYFDMTTYASRLGELTGGG